MFEGVKGTKFNWNVYTSKIENAEENCNHEFWGKMFSLVAITFTSLKVSVTVSKQVLRKETNGVRGGFKISIEST